MLNSYKHWSNIVWQIIHYQTAYSNIKSIVKNNKHTIKQHIITIILETPGVGNNCSQPSSR